jgi:hypothetical protein
MRRLGGGEVGNLKRYLGHVIARKVSRINLNANEVGAAGELEDGPIVTHLAAAARLPPIHHLALYAKGIGVKTA